MAFMGFLGHSGGRAAMRKKYLIFRLDWSSTVCYNVPHTGRWRREKARLHRRGADGQIHRRDAESAEKKETRVKGLFLIKAIYFHSPRPPRLCGEKGWNLL